MTDAAQTVPRYSKDSRRAPEADGREMEVRVTILGEVNIFVFNISKSRTHPKYRHS